MNWKNEAANDLSSYVRKKESLRNIKQHIAALEMQQTAIKGAMADSTPVMGGGNKYEDRILDNIVKRGRLNLSYLATEKVVNLIERGLQELDENERLVLDKFYMHRQNDKNRINTLTSTLHIEQAQVYRLKNEALYKFTISMYGMLES